MNVELIRYTAGALDVLFSAARRCYSTDEDWKKRFTVDYESRAKLVSNVIASGHISILEHISYTFSVTGVSRVLSHQLVRHRHASYSQQSQRYTAVDSIEGKYVMPPSIAHKSEAEELFCKTMEQIYMAYNNLIEFHLIPREDARYLLPNAMHTSLVVTMNARELYETFFPLRCCTRAQWEIRELAERILVLCKSTLPEVFSNAGPRCALLGRCPEAKSCGKYPS